MLIPYPYQSHSIQKIEDFVRYLFVDVMFEAQNHKSQSLQDVILKDYKPLFGYTSVKSGKTRKKAAFPKAAENLYDAFKNLQNNQIEALKKAFDKNVQIREICEGKVAPVRFSDLEQVIPNIGNQNFLDGLQKFCEMLYTRCLDLKAFEKKFGILKDYYDGLVDDDDVCHCCGIEPILTRYNSKRDAFDHYISKAKYPFVSVNFRNLIPICYTCNSTYKNQQDTVYCIKNGVEKQRKVFYPYYESNETPYKIEIGVQLKCCYQFNGFKMDDIQIDYKCKGHEEALKSWKALYGIDERYKAYCLSKKSKTFIKELYDKYKVDNDFVKKLFEFDGSMPLVNANFLRLPFAKAVFDSFPKNV